MDMQFTNQQGEMKPGQTITEDKGKEIHHHHYYYGHQARRGAINFGQLFFGLLLLFFGIAYLAKSLGIAYFDIAVNWTMAFSLLIIVAGLSLITFRGWLGGLIGVIVVFILASVIFFLTLTPVNFHQLGGGDFMNWPKAQFNLTK